MATVNLAPGAFGAGYQAFDTSGMPLNGGLIYTYLSGTTTPQATYTTSVGNVQNANPIVCGTDGRPLASGNITEIWLVAGLAYTFVVTDSLNNTIATYNGLVGVNDVAASSSTSEWLATGLTPTFISTTSFSFVGNQTGTFPVGIRTKSTNTSGTIYSNVTAASYSAGPNTTTITVSNDSGVIDSGISAVSYSILRSDNESLPPYNTLIPVLADSTDPTKRAKFSLAGNTTATDRTYTLPDSNFTVGAIGFPRGRITLTTLVPVTTANVTAATSHFYTPYIGNTVPIYNGTVFSDTVFTELTQLTTDNTKSPAAVAASKVYDLFVWNDAGTIRCTRGPAWTNDTTPGTGAGTSQLSMILGIMVNTVTILNGPAAQRGTYVGTIRSDGSSQLNDSLLLRYVANAYNDVDRPCSVVDATNSWTYTTATFQQANASAANQIGVVQPQLPFARMTSATTTGIVNNTAANATVSVGVGVDSTTVNSAQTLGCSALNAGVAGAPFQTTAQYRGYIGIGAHLLIWLEISQATNTTTWYGDNNLAYWQSGLVASIRG